MGTTNLDATAVSGNLQEVPDDGVINEEQKHHNKRAANKYSFVSLR